MANIKITDLTAYTDAASTDVLPIVDVGADVTKKITIGNVVKAVPLGTAALPGLAFDGDPNTGIYSPGGDQVAISTNGTGRLFVDASGNIKLGSAAAAGFRLAVDGDTWFGNQAGTEIGRLFNDAGVLCLRASSNVTGLGLATNSSSSHAIRIDSSGRVGLGTSSPSTNLDIVVGSGTATQKLGSGSVAGGSYLNLHGASASKTWFVGANYNFAGVLEFTQSTANGGTTPSSTPAMVLSAAGNVGIGTTSPSYELDIQAAGNSRIKVKNTSVTGESQFHHDGNGDLNIINTVSGRHLKFFNTGSERARIDSDGRLLVGTSSVTDTNSKFVVQGRGVTGDQPAQVHLRRSEGAASITSGEAVGFICFTDNEDKQFAVIGCSADADAGSDDYPGSLVFRVTEDGNSSPTTSPSAMTINNAQEVLIGYSSDNGAYKLQVNSQIFATSATIATSDGRYKENIATLDGCLDLVKALRPVSFTWKPQQAITQINDEGEETVVREPHNFPEGTQVGFIAQEVQEVLEGKPWLGSVIKENVRPAVKDNDGNELAPEEQFYGIAEGNLIAVLTNALQEAIGRIETLETEVAALKS